eukprot:gb/GEZN01010597.1/.p1 GENE.gb/GEZN01010597.1/~~gb/GEZN01010597.1/.p1  ORF type:complete len:366 (-),score=47.94 gb/GEZN01010597.1/:43-1140(-)
MSGLRLKQLESFLQSVEAFDNPSFRLEQYPTSAYLAAQITSLIQSQFSDLTDKLVADLGCGCGMLSIACAAFDAGAVVGFELDSAALTVCRRNLEQLELARDIELVQIDVTSLCSGDGLAEQKETGLPTEQGHTGKVEAADKHDQCTSTNREADQKKQPTQTVTKTKTQTDQGSETVSEGAAAQNKPEGTSAATQTGRLRHPRWQFDTVVMNPPFGARNAGIDMVFLEAALQMVRDGGAVYSLHKTSTRQHVLKRARTLGAGAKVLAELQFDIPKMYKFHKDDSRDVEVDLVRVWPLSDQETRELSRDISHTSGPGEGCSEERRTKDKGARGPERGRGGRGARGRGKEVRGRTGQEKGGKDKGRK